MNPKIIILLAIVPFMFSPGVHADSTVIAKVGTSEVRADDIKPLLDKLPLRDQLALAKDPAALNEFVRALIIQQPTTIPNTAALTYKIQF